MARLSRRAFLVLAALFAAAARLRAQPAAISVDAFLSLSQRLVGRPTLDAQVAAIYLNALVAVPANVPLLAQLARGAASSPEQLALERTIIECWYTGIYTVNGERRVATHIGALMWSAIGVSAPGGCTGAFGAWSRAPRAAA